MTTNAKCRGLRLLSAASAIAIAALSAMPSLADELAKWFDIPAQSLSTALIKFSEQSDIVVVIAPDLVAGKVSTPVRGSLVPAAALNQILSGSGLRVLSRPDGGFTLAQAAASTTPAEPAQSEAAAGSAQAVQEPVPVRSAGTDSVEKVTVTGTRIRGGTPASPVITIDEKDIERSGSQTAGDVIRALPQSFGGGMNVNVVGAAGSGNPSNFSASSSANLRGLGSDSTLTLVNGHRLAYADELSVVDASLIPLAAIKRVEVLTDGASAIYGSDAVAGVVNFILKKDFEGLQTSATFGDSSQGGGALQRYDVLGGDNWSNGNVLLSFEHFEQDPILAGERGFPSPLSSRTTLAPSVDRDSGFFAGNQAIGPNVELFGQGLYTTRSANSQSDLSAFVPGLIGFSRADVEQYGLVAGMTLDLGGDWRTSLSGDLARTVTDNSQRVFLGSTQTGANDFAFRTGLRQVELSAAGPLFELSSGSVDVAFGAAHRRETLSDLVLISGNPDTNLSQARHIESAYAEVRIPLVSESVTRDWLNSLTLVAAGRHDQYSDVGPSTIPKVGLAWALSPELQIRGAWGKSFRAPSLVQAHVQETSFLLSTTDPSSPSGSSIILLRFGGNSDLTPETAETTTINAAYAPSWFAGASVDLTYFDVDYRDRITNPFANAFVPLLDPFATSFVLINPTPAQQADVISASAFTNLTGLPYDPATVVAIADGRLQNVTDQSASGVDVLLRYQLPTNVGTFDFAVNAAYLELRRHITPLAPEQQLSGTVFNPPRFRMRNGLSWHNDQWEASLFVNYAGPWEDPSASPTESVDSWTTADVQIAYDFRDAGFLAGTRILFSVQNVLDVDPPFITGATAGLPGLHYDSTNASATGRFFSLQLVKDW